MSAQTNQMESVEKGQQAQARGQIRESMKIGGQFTERQLESPSTC